jgi:hypothetical protein
MGDSAEVSDESIASRLLAAGAASNPGPIVDVEFYAIRLELDQSTVRRGLKCLAKSGRLTCSAGWICTACGSENDETSVECHNCNQARSIEAKPVELFSRSAQPSGRDPAALFLIHGMTTDGAWQQVLAWKTQLLYGYSVPVFIFKFGWDAFSPLRRASQLKRTAQLAESVRQVQCDLQGSGREQRCDVVAHSFGTLLLATLLSEPDYSDLVFGRVILSGSIVDREYDWDGLLASGRVEAVLNHRAERDSWVRLAPWFFPNVGSSGVNGFNASASVVDRMSETFKHSDYFTRANFASVLLDVWTPFLTTRSHADTPVALTKRQRRRNSARFWVGRVVLAVVGATILVSVLAVTALIGRGVQMLWEVIAG